MSIRTQVPGPVGIARLDKLLAEQDLLRVENP
jgi:hypothetical protein